MIFHYRFSKAEINERVASFRTLLLRQPYAAVKDNNNASDERYVQIPNVPFLHYAKLELLKSRVVILFSEVW